MTELEQYIKSYFGVVNDDDMKTIVSFFKSTKTMFRISPDYNFVFRNRLPAAVLKYFSRFIASASVENSSK